MPEPEGDLFAELRRRNVFRVAAMYAVVAWLAIQVADATFEVLGIPESAHRILILVALAGFPVAVTIGWYFDWTDGGLVRTPSAAESNAGAELERLRGRRRIDFAIIAILVLALGMSLFVGPRLQGSLAEAEGPSSLVVLPFDDMSAGGDEEYFAHGISEELRSALGSLPDVRVIGRTSAEAASRSGAGISEIGEQLGVDAVVEGSVRRGSDRVRVNVQLLQAEDGLPLWSETYERPMGNLFELQGQLASDVAAALDRRLKAAALPRPTESLEAYDAYLTGRHLMGRQTEESLAGAIAEFERATRADPDFGLAWSGLSDALSLSWTLDVLRDPEVVPRAVDAAERAVSLRPDSAEAQTSLGRIQWINREWRASEASLRRAIELNPGYAFAYQSLALVLVNLGEFEPGLAASHRSVDLEPLSPYMHVNLAANYNATHDWENALRVARRANSLEPGNVFARYYQMSALEEMGDPDAAFEIGLSMAPPQVHEPLRQAYAAQGMDGLRQVMLKAAQSVAGGDPCGGLTGTMILAQLARTEVALGCLEAGVQLPGMYANIYPRFNLVFESLHDDPRFTTLLASIGLGPPGLRGASAAPAGL